MPATASGKESLYQSEWWARLAAITENGKETVKAQSNTEERSGANQSLRSLISNHASGWKNRLLRINQPAHEALT